MNQLLISVSTDALEDRMKVVCFKNVDTSQSENNLKLIEESSNVISSLLNKVKDKWHDKTVDVPCGT